jgi:RNA polymerase sigma-70 factor (ECF subfamily)
MVMALVSHALAVAGQSSSGPAFAVRAEETTVFRPSEGEAVADRQTERRLIRAAQSGSAEAIEALFRTYWPRAYRAAHMVAQDAVAAEDIAQEAFLSALRAIDRFDRRRPFGPWLHRIAVNRAIDWTRTRAIRREVFGIPAIDSSAMDDPFDDPRAAALHDAVCTLSPDHRAVVAMRYVYDWTPGEIAKALNLPRGTVNSRLRRALDHLAAELEDQS